MPVLFIGHGSPMNAIEQNEFAEGWERIAREIPEPAAVLVVSAHWLTRGTHITAMEKPKTIHDFGGFPQALFDVQYPAPGDPEIAIQTIELIKQTTVHADHDWGLDHGAWSVVKQMFPKANIPVLQLSIDYHQSPQYHYNLASELYELRKKGILIIGSGNMVHNLRMLSIQNMNDFNAEFGFDWALEMNDVFKKKINAADHQSLINFRDLHSASHLAIPTPDHYYPLLYAAGAAGKNADPFIFNDKAVAGSLTMTSVAWV